LRGGALWRSHQPGFHVAMGGSVAGIWWTFDVTLPVPEERRMKSRRSLHCRCESLSVHASAVGWRSSPLLGARRAPLSVHFPASRSGRQSPDTAGTAPSVHDIWRYPPPRLHWTTAVLTISAHLVVANFASHFLRLCACSQIKMLPLWYVARKRTTYQGIEP
jgi:hypothetical protein